MGSSPPHKSNGIAFEHAAQWYAWSEKHLIGQMELSPHYRWGWKKDRHAPGALNNARGTSVEVNYTTCCGGEYYRWTIVVLAHIYLLSPKQTSSKCSRFCCFWPLIAIRPGFPKLLLCALWHIRGPLNLSKYCPRENMAWHGWPGLPALRPAHCAVRR